MEQQDKNKVTLEEGKLTDEHLEQAAGGAVMFDEFCQKCGKPLGISYGGLCDDCRYVLS